MEARNPNPTTLSSTPPGARTAVCPAINEPGDYRLDWYYSPHPGVPAESNGIEVLLDGTIIDMVAEDGTGLSDTAWMLRSVPFTVDTTATLEFLATGTADGVGGYIDSVTISPVPEPGTLALIASGLLGLPLVRRKRN